MEANNPYAPPKAPIAEVVGELEPAPALWNPNAAACWSLLFTPIFGAYLHMKNWRAMGQSDKAAAAERWVLVSVAYLVLMTCLTFVLGESKEMDALSRFGGLGLLFTWYSASGKPQVKDVLARYGKHYPRRGWLMPLLIALGGLIAFVAVAAAIGMIFAWVQAGQ